MVVRPKLLNAQAFLESLCCFSFSVSTLYLVTSGQYLAYVTPRMKPYLYFTAAVMLLWSWTGLGRPPQHKTRSAHCLVLALPILLLLLPHGPLSTSDLSYAFARGGGARSGDSTPGGPDISEIGDLPDLSAIPDPSDILDPSDIPDLSELLSGESPPVPQDSVASAALSGLDASAKRITISDGEFYPWLEEMFMNPDTYAGYAVKMTGFVLKDPELLQPDEFVPARLVMSCCVADLLPYGMICKYEKTEELQNDTWVTVEGVIHITEENGYREPQARITAITPAAAIEGYIYPF
ncbi:MAG: TIGR03943 family protein [Synergistaceae bacterium]|nr:TIGR03943 family protein [Synergistaceae bacterium]